MNSLLEWLGGRLRLLGDSVSAAELSQVIDSESVPSVSFFFLLFCSTVIATFGLLSNSAAVIIGAMIVAPLMSPIIALAFALVAGRRLTSMRSALTIICGTLLTIALSFGVTEVIGWKLAGSEITARMKPSLLDLGVAMASGAAAAFAYTRPNVSAALVGIAIAVALVPPLCTVGIALSFGQDARPEAGQPIEIFSARGPLLLYLTNIIGIVLAAGLVFWFKCFRRRLKSIPMLAAVAASLLLVIPPLGLGMDNLLIRNQIRRSLSVEASKAFPESARLRLTELHVRIRQGRVWVKGGAIGDASLVTQARLDKMRDLIEDIVDKPVEMEFSIVPETIVRSSK